MAKEIAVRVAAFTNMLVWIILSYSLSCYRHSKKQFDENIAAEKELKLIKRDQNMAERERVEKAVFEAIDEMNVQLPKGVVIEKTNDAPLYGSGGQLESLDFVAFILEVETKIQNEFGVDFVLTDEDLLSKEKSPFSTVGSLVEHLQETLKGNE